MNQSEYQAKSLDHRIKEEDKRISDYVGERGKKVGKNPKKSK